MGDVAIGTVLVTGAESGLGAAVAQAVAGAGGTPALLDRVPPPHDADHEIVDLPMAGTHGRRHRRVRPDRGRGGRRVGARAQGKPVRRRGRRAGRAANAGRQRRPRIVTVASTLGLRALSDATASCASKFGVVGFTRALAAETAGRVGMTLLIPGGMHTAFFDSREERYRPPPDARLNRPEDVAEAGALRPPTTSGMRGAGAGRVPVTEDVLAIRLAPARCGGKDGSPDRGSRHVEP